MRVIVRTAVLAAALAVPSAANAAPTAFKGKVCSLVSSATITAIPDLLPVCTQQSPQAVPGGTDYAGTWKGKTATTTLHVTVESFTDSGMLALATRNLKQGLVAAPKRVSGVGDNAYEAKNPTAVELKLATGSHIVVIILSSERNPPDSPAELVPLAKAIVTALA